MLSPQQVPSEIEQIGNRSMDSHESLRLLLGLESSQSSLPLPCGFVRLLGAIVLVLLGTVYRLGDQLSMSNAVAS